MLTTPERALPEGLHFKPRSMSTRLEVGDRTYYRTEVHLNDGGLNVDWTCEQGGRVSYPTPDEIRALEAQYQQDRRRIFAEPTPTVKTVPFCDLYYSMTSTIEGLAASVASLDDEEWTTLMMRLRSQSLGPIATQLENLRTLWTRGL